MWGKTKEALDNFIQKHESDILDVMNAVHSSSNAGKSRNNALNAQFNAELAEINKRITAEMLERQKNSDELKKLSDQMIKGNDAVLKTSELKLNQLESKLNDKLSQLKDNITDTFIEKLHEIKLFKASEDELMKNPILSTLVSELVKREFENVERFYVKRDEESSKKEIILNNKIKEIEKLSDKSLKSPVEINEKRKELQLEKEKYERLTSSDEDKYGLEVKKLNYLIDFIDKWLIA